MTRPVPYIDPSRPRRRIKPFKAWGHMQNLIADKEDTSQVFHIVEALNGDADVRDFELFMASANGPKLLAQRRHLPDMLDDHAPIEQLPEGTVGRAYLTFMQRENLSAAGLVAESEVQRNNHAEHDDDLLWYVNRLRDTHDLYHVLTGYNRDALGEAALLGYTHSQHQGRGISFIAFMGGRLIAKHAPREARIKEVIAEGRRNGKTAKRIIEQDISALLREPIAAARARLNIAKPVLYRNALRVIAEHGIDPMLITA